VRPGREDGTAPLGDLCASSMFSRNVPGTVRA
jgi:hypothetical protein